METKLDRVGTIELAIKAMQVLPSKELYGSSFVIGHEDAADIPVGDVRYCIRGLLCAYTGGYKGRNYKRVSEDRWLGKILDLQTASDLEDALYAAESEQDVMFWDASTKKTRRAAYRGTLKRAKAMLREAKLEAKRNFGLI